MLTPSKFGSYTRLVRSPIIAAGFLGVWLVLLAGDACEDLGFLHDDLSFDLAIDVALADLGQAIGAAHDSDAAALHAAHDQSPATPILLPAALFTNTIFRVALRETHSPSEPATRHGERSTVLLL
jgi:hypothetical protein